MTTPTNLPTGYNGTYTDYLHTKADRDGCARLQYSSISITAAATAGTTYGLVPFNKGFRLSYGSRLSTADLDTSTNVTLDIGYTYKTGSSATDDPDAFATALSAQTAGVLTFDEVAGLSWVAEDDGWITVTLAAGPTTTTGTVGGQFLGVYDGLSAAN